MQRCVLPIPTSMQQGMSRRMIIRSMAAGSGWSTGQMPKIKGAMWRATCWVPSDLASLEFTSFWLKDGAVAAALIVNQWDDGDALQELVDTGRQVSDKELLSSCAPREGVSRGWRGRGR